MSRDGTKHQGAENRRPEDLGERLRCVPRILHAINHAHGGRVDEHELADLVQIVALVAIRKIDTYRLGTSFESWVYRIAYLELMNALRRRSRGPQPLQPEEIPSSDPGVPVDYEALYAGLGELEPAEVDVMRLRYFQGLTFLELSGQLGIPLGTAKTRHYRAMQRLRRFLDARRGAET